MAPVVAARPRAFASFTSLLNQHTTALNAAPRFGPRFITCAKSITSTVRTTPKRATIIASASRNFSQSARRCDQHLPPKIELSPTPIKKKRTSILRWAWRLIKYSAFGAVAYIGYGIWVSRNPADQFEPDPSKKTLVVLGTGWGSVSLLKKLDTENYNVVIVSPRNYFLFTPLLPSCTTGTIEHRSIMEPIRNFLRHKKASVKYYEADAKKIDYEKKIVYIDDDSDVKGDVSSTEVPFDMLVVGVGAENATFGAYI